jgi:type I restriction enzyme S subunit
MTNWKEYKLENIIKVKHGYAFKGAFFSKEPTDDILLSPGNFNIGGGFKADKFKYYNGTYPESYILKEGDIIVTMTDLSKEGDTLGYSAKIPPHNGIKYLHNQRLGLLELIDNDFNLDFLYWLLRTRDYQQFIVSSATGTTVKHTSPTRICEYVFKAPDYKTQTAIAEILSSLDDKIELNNKINQELENLAQTLFKQWFIDFEFPANLADDTLSGAEGYKSSGGEMIDSELGEIPKEWEVKTLKDEFTLNIVQSPKGDTYNEEAD